QSVLKQAMLQAPGGVLVPELLPPELLQKVPTIEPALQELSAGPCTTLHDLERAAIQQCLSHTGGNRRRTAELLGISTRTLLRKIRTYELEDPRRPALIEKHS